MGNALVGKEVNTVTEFVQALQDKNATQCIYPKKQNT